MSIAASIEKDRDAASQLGAVTLAWWCSCSAPASWWFCAFP